MPRVFDAGDYKDQAFDILPPKEQENWTFQDSRFSACSFRDHRKSWPYGFANCTFEDCTFELHGSGYARSFDACKFFGCTFVFHDVSQQFFSNDVSFENCRFEGSLKDCVFSNKSTGKPALKSCDFTAAKLSLVEFRGEEVAIGCKWPDWPIICLDSGPRFQATEDEYALPLQISMVGRHTRTAAVFHDLAAEGLATDDFWAAAHDAPFLRFPSKGIKPAPSAERTATVRTANSRARSIDALYTRTFRMLEQNASITNISGSGDTFVLKLKGRGLAELGLPDPLNLTLNGCSLLEHRDQDGKSLNINDFPSSFRIMSRRIDHANNRVVLRGHRKALGELHLSFSSASPDVEDLLASQRAKSNKSTLATLVRQGLHRFRKPRLAVCD